MDDKLAKLREECLKLADLLSPETQSASGMGLAWCMFFKDRADNIKRLFKELGVDE